MASPNQKNNEMRKLDLEAAREAVDFFAGTGGVSCSLLDHSGSLIYEKGPEFSPCAACERLRQKLGCSFGCEGLHPFAARQSERFGGRYIYFCSIGLAFFASPIISAGIYS